MASSLMSFRTDIRKHRTLPNNMLSKYQSNSISYCQEEEEFFDEKYDDVSVSYTSRSESQLALPSRNKYTTTESILEDDEFDDDDDSIFDDDDEYDDYMMEDPDSYSAALKKLSGISFKSKAGINRAVLITLSPCSLAAANAARQRRQKFRITQ
ncbi:uncharacterized protein EV154DRAFT_496737 [Mucor mucedo]|nr:uncharacterized protein EV154DRAFT_496737 [Mucor mucedo]KAI7895023.1 hypothetical protein EV154DRAFT_496737 [Mucor mucedo]